LEVEHGHREDVAEQEQQRVERLPLGRRRDLAVDREVRKERLEVLAIDEGRSVIADEGQEADGPPPVRPFRADGQMPKAHPARELQEEVGTGRRSLSVDLADARNASLEAFLVRVVQEQGTPRLSDLPFREMVLQTPDEAMHSGSLIR
jgi:hypothetical protein